MMTFGTIGAFGFDDFHPPEVIGLYAQAGCTVVQAYRNRDKNITAKEMSTVCRDLGVRIDSLHAHFGDDLDPSSENERVRKSAVDLYYREAEFCLDLGGDLAVVHPSPPKGPVGNLEKRYSQLQRSFEELAEIGQRIHVKFAFENMPAYHPVGGDVKRLVNEVARCGSEHVVFLLDFGHAHLTCGIVEGVRFAGKHLRYTHVHDNDGVNDTHRLPYQGTLPWDACREALHEIGYDGVFLLEVFEKAANLRTMLHEGWKADVGAMLRNGR